MKDEKSFKQLEDALFYNPKAKEQLADLRDFYSEHTSNFRKLGEGLKGFIPETFRSGILAKTVDLIFEPKWSGELKKLAEADKESLPKLAEDFAKKIGARSALGATHGVKEHEHEEEPAKEAPKATFSKEEALKELERRKNKSAQEPRWKNCLKN